MIAIELPLRPAVQSDIPFLVFARHAMFEEMFTLENRAFDPAELSLMDGIFRQTLLAHLGEEDQQGWVVEAAGQPVACAMVYMMRLLPAPGRLDRLQPLLHNVYTLTEYRKQGHARRLVEAALAWCKAQGYSGMVLHASQAGRPLYESLGFKQTSEMGIKFV
jgi:GNAT superfamily N-acetyltransferase